MWIGIIIAVLVGMFMPLQAGVNSSLAKYLNHPFHAAFISFLGGLLAMTIGSFFFRATIPSLAIITKIPPHLFIGGLLGASLVLTAIVLAPKLGAVVLISCFITGQMVASVILDHYGWIGFSAHPISIGRIVGIIFLFLGVILVRIF